MSSSKPTNRSEIQDIKSILAELERILSADDAELGAATREASAEPEPEAPQPEEPVFDSERSLRTEVALLEEEQGREPPSAFDQTGERTIKMSDTARTRALASAAERVEPVQAPEAAEAVEPAEAVESSEAVEPAESVETAQESFEALIERLEEAPESEAEEEPAELEASFLPDLEAEPEPTPSEEAVEAEGLDVALELLSNLPQEEEAPSDLEVSTPEIPENEMDEPALEPLDLANDLEEGSPSNLEPLDELEPQEEGPMSDQDTPKRDERQDKDNVAEEEDVLDLATLLENVEEEPEGAAEPQVEEAASEADAAAEAELEEDQVLELDLALPEDEEGLLETVKEEELESLEADVNEAQSPIASAEDLKDFESAYLDALLLNDEDFDAAMKESGVVLEEAAPQEAGEAAEEVAPAAEAEEEEEIPLPDISDIDLSDLADLGEEDEGEASFDEELTEGGAQPDLDTDLMFPEEEANPDVEGTGNFGDTLTGVSGKEEGAEEVAAPGAPAWQVEPLAAAAETAVAGAASVAGQAAVAPAAQATGIDAAQLAALLAPMIEKVVRDTVLEVAERVIREEMGKLREALDEEPDA